jgi:predicted FMN-binding regulatory protein PaiB
MFVPRHVAMSDREVHDLLSDQGAGESVTAARDGLLATLVMFDLTVGGARRVLGHRARNDDQWRQRPTGGARDPGRA